jgi:DNA-binding CsgD family transcriptional regulator
LWRRNLPQAEKYFSLGYNYCIEKDIDSMWTFIAGDYARTKLFMGNWDEAVDIANTVLKRNNISFMQRIVPLYVIGIIRTRRNDPGTISIFNELNSKIGSVGEIWEMIVTVKVATAEIYWLQNKLEDIIDEIEIIYNKLRANGNLWLIGELAFWLWKANRLKEIPERIAKPYLLMIRGEWKSAAKLWEELKCPYEQAMALSCGDEEAMKNAIEIFNRLSASATSQLIKQKMRAQGVRSIPKGPRRTTRNNPSGLTLRQIEILNLLGKGLSNNEIGNKLFISPKTVDHHISAILSKLNIHSRYEAAAFVHSNHDQKI